MTVAVGRTRRKRGNERSWQAIGPSARLDPDDLLAWYDRNRRKLPWRAGPGEQVDPYRVWLSEIMLQQTTVKTVVPYFARFTARWPHVHALAAAPLDDVLRLWAGLGYYARARNLHACARAVVERHGGRFPATEAELGQLPGVGPYTAAAIAAIAFGARAAAVDGNVERVITRLFAVEDELPAAKPLIRQLASGLLPDARSGDFAQALMDLGATICTPKKPACALCPWMAMCAGAHRGDPETFPRKTRKREGHLRRGAAFVAVRADDAVLLRTRPPRGLLGGMSEVPTSAWADELDEPRALGEAPHFSSSLHMGEVDHTSHAPAPATDTGSSDATEAASHGNEPATHWRRIPGVVTHVFTHFPLELVVYVARVPASTSAPAGTRFVARAALADEALPNLMRKVIAHALGPQPALSCPT